ncbi:hypothetical protein CES87_29615 [Pseudomonas sp. ERMR1:02]|nr:hypothetical protein CES87_29615 [Pseudomonas sp. ERMR1:02]
MAVEAAVVTVAIAPAVITVTATMARDTPATQLQTPDAAAPMPSRVTIMAFIVRVKSAMTTAFIVPVKSLTTMEFIALAKSVTIAECMQLVSLVMTKA